MDESQMVKPCGHYRGACGHGTLAEQITRIPDKYLGSFWRRLARGEVVVLSAPTTDDCLDKPRITYDDGTTLSERLDKIIDAEVK